MSKKSNDPTTTIDDDASFIRLRTDEYWTPTTNVYAGTEGTTRSNEDIQLQDVEKHGIKVRTDVVREESAASLEEK